MIDTKFSFIGSLKGAACSLLLLLLLDPGRAFTQKELCQITRYSDKSVSDGLELLASHQLATFHGKQNGWALASGVKQLELFERVALPDPSHPAQHGDVNEQTTVDNSVDKPVDNFQNDLPAQQGEGTEESEEHGNFPTSSPTNTEIFRLPPPATYTRTRTRVSSSSFKPLSEAKREKKKEGPPPTRKFSDLPQTNTPSPNWGVMEWLVWGGIGHNSPVMKQLLALQLPLPYVKAHVNHIRENDEPPAWLITRLRCGDPPPRPKPGRDSNPVIPPHLRDIIKT